MDSLTGVADLDPSCEVVTKEFVLTLDAKGEVTRQYGPLVGVGEVAYGCFVKNKSRFHVIGREAVHQRPG